MDLNVVEDSLRVYRSEDVEDFLKRSDWSQPPSPEWVVNRSDKEGPIIHKWCWLSDSSGVAFLERTVNGNQRLVLASLRDKTVEPLTPETETVKAFDIRDRQHYVYTANDPVKRWTGHVDPQASSVVGTGHTLYELLLPDDPATIRFSPNDSYLWAVAGGGRFEIKHGGAPLVPGVLALSPDGASLVTTLRVHDVPAPWERLYPPPTSSDPYRFRAGGSMDQYVRIDLQTGSIQALTNAPTSRASGLWAPVLSNPKWSNNGQKILLPGTFLSSERSECIATVRCGCGSSV